MSVEGVGARVKRKEDKRFITGRGRYTDDMVVAGMHHAAFARSQHAHARIRSIDVSAARSMPGVVAVLTGEELAADKIGNIICGWAVKSKNGAPMKMGAYPPLAKETVRYVGQPYAVVVAETRLQARDAAEAVEVDWEELPALIDLNEAIKEGSHQIHPEAEGNLIFDWEIGDSGAVDAAIARAAHVTKMEIVNNRLVPNAMEPRSALGVYDPSEEHFTLYTTSQNPHVARLVISAFYNVAPENKLRVIAPDVGGGFGSKIFIYPEEIVCLWAAKRAGVPVKWTSDRTEAFLTDAHGRDHITSAQMAFDADNPDIGFRSTQSQLRRLHVAVLLSGSDLPLRNLAVGAVRTSRRSTATSAPSTPTRLGGCYRGAGSTGGDLCGRADRRDGRRGELGISSGGTAPEEFRPNLPPTRHR
jgi:carbon-monoxide dehydrogenase large subunit